MNENLDTLETITISPKSVRFIHNEDKSQNIFGNNIIDNQIRFIEPIINHRSTGNWEERVENEESSSKKQNVKHMNKLSWKERLCGCWSSKKVKNTQDESCSNKAPPIR